MKLESCYPDIEFIVVDPLFLAYYILLIDGDTVSFNPIIVYELDILRINRQDHSDGNYSRSFAEPYEAFREPVKFVLDWGQLDFIRGLMVKHGYIDH